MSGRSSARMRLGDIRIDTDGNFILVGVEELTDRLLQQEEERRQRLAAEQRARDRHLWSNGLALWIDRWTPFYFRPIDLLEAPEGKLSMTMAMVLRHPRVTAVRA